MSSQQSAAQNRVIMKVIFVGNSGVGKTCLIASYFHSSFEAKIVSTVSPTYSFTDLTNCDGVPIRLQIWDTAGQERYISISQLFFRDADVAFICFDSVETESINAVYKWVSLVKEEVPHCKILFVITKKDLHTDEEIDKMIETATHELATLSNSPIFITSSKERIGIDEIFQAAANSYAVPVREKPKELPIAATEQKSSSCC